MFLMFYLTCTQGKEGIVGFDGYDGLPVRYSQYVSSCRPFLWETGYQNLSVYGVQIPGLILLEISQILDKAWYTLKSMSFLKDLEMCFINWLFQGIHGVRGQKGFPGIPGCKGEPVSYYDCNN